MTRLVYIVDSLAIFGGIERVVIDKINWLAKEPEYEVTLLTVNQGKHPVVFQLDSRVIRFDLNILFHRKYQFWGINRIVYGMILHKRFRRQMEALLNKLSPHVIICTRIYFIQDIVKISNKIPVVFEAHNSCSHEFEGDSFFRQLNALFWYRFLKKIKMVVTLTKGDAEEWYKYNQNVRVIPNVVNLNKTNTYSNCSSKSVIFVGRYSYQKDIMTLLKIWRLVHKRYPEWVLNIFGGYGEQQEKILNEIGVNNLNIVLHNPKQSINEEYKRNSFLLLTSRYEPFGLVLPEAMSCGLPVVAFNCPYGPADIINDGIDGFLIANRCVEEYVEKVCLLIENEQLRIDMGKAGILSSQRFNECIIMPQWKKLFEELIAFN